MSVAAHLSKDLRLVLRDRQALAIGVALPAIILAAYAQLGLDNWVTIEGRDPDAFILVLAATLPALLVASTVLLSERRGGTLERVGRTPTDPAVMVLSKFTIAMGLAAVQVAVMLVVARLVLSAEANAAPEGLALLLVLCALGAYVAGLAIGALARTSAQAHQLVALVFLLMLTLAGFLRPLDRIGLVGDAARYAPMALGYDGVLHLFAGQPDGFHPLALGAFILAGLALTMVLVARRR